LTNEWRSWPQVQIDITYRYEAVEWLTKNCPKDEFVPVYHGSIASKIAIKSDKYITYMLIKYTAELLLCEDDQERDRKEKNAAMDAEIKRLLKEITEKIKDTNVTDNIFRENIKERLLYSKGKIIGEKNVKK